MTRSYRKPAQYICHGAQPDKGKKFTSREIRCHERKLISNLLEDPESDDFVHIQDKKRGSAGSRSHDYGWNFFGDGRIMAYEDSIWGSKFFRNFRSNPHCKEYNPKLHRK